MSQSGGKFGRKKEEAIVALLSQRSVDDAARAVSITPRTLYRWRILELEIGAGIIDTETSRREREFAETIGRRIGVGRARLGLPARTFNDSERRDLAGLTIEQILNRGRLRARERALAEAN